MQAAVVGYGKEWKFWLCGCVLTGCFPLPGFHFGPLDPPAPAGGWNKGVPWGPRTNYPSCSIIWAEHVKNDIIAFGRTWTIVHSFTDPVGRETSPVEMLLDQAGDFLRFKTQYLNVRNYHVWYILLGVLNYCFFYVSS